MSLAFQPELPSCINQSHSDLFLTFLSSTSSYFSLHHLPSPLLISCLQKSLCIQGHKGLLLLRPNLLSEVSAQWWQGYGVLFSDLRWLKSSWSLAVEWDPEHPILVRYVGVGDTEGQPDLVPDAVVCCSAQGRGIGTR